MNVARTLRRPLQIAAAGCALTLLTPLQLAGQAQEPVVITAQQQWLSQDQAHVLLILKNTSSEPRGNISINLELADDDGVYVRIAGHHPDKTVLMPNEETVYFNRSLLVSERLELGPIGPENVTVTVTSESAQPSDYPYVEPPRLRHGALSVGHEGPWTYTWMEGEFVNDSGSRTLEATRGIPNEGFWESNGGSYFPFDAVVVFQKDGRVLGADRPFSRRGGHLAPGETANIQSTFVTKGPGPDAFKIYTAAKALAPGALPVRWLVRSDGWTVTDQLPRCVGGRSCPGIMFDFEVENASDVAAFPFMRPVVRDTLGRPVDTPGCYRRDGPLAPGAVHRCHLELQESGLGTPIHPSRDITLEDIGSISVHVTSVEVTHDPRFAAIPALSPPCFKRINAPEAPPAFADHLPFRAWLPTLLSFGRACGDS